MAEKGAEPKVPKLQRRVLKAIGTWTSPLLPDDYLEMFNPLWSTRELRGVIEAIDEVTEDTVCVRIKPGAEWPGHRAGQYVRVGFIIDGVHHWRAYSLTSEPERTDGCITITPKLVEKGKVTTWLVNKARPGELVKLSAVEGTFHLPEDVETYPPLLFISAGSGITPVVAMLRQLDDEDQMRDVVHLHSARDADDVIYGDELRAFADKHEGYTLIERHTAKEDRLSPEELDDLVPDWRERRAYHSGPAEMLDAMEAHWEAEGAHDNLYMERFQPSEVVGDGEKGKGGSIKLRRSETTAESDGTVPILVAAEEAGAEMPYGCRMGICHTCVGLLAVGSVRDLRTGEVSNAEGSMIRTCVNAPEGDVEIDL